MDIQLSDAITEAFKSHIVAVQEESVNVDGCFVVASLLEGRIAKKHKILFILHHHSFGHFQGVGSKMSINFQSLKDTGRLSVVDVLEKVGSRATDKTLPFDEDRLKFTLEEVIREAQSIVTSSHANNEPITLFVDHPADIAIAFNALPAVLHYVKYLQSLASLNTRIIYMTGPTGCQIDALNALIRHYADVTVLVRGLSMGMATDISGVLEVICKDCDVQKATKQNEFHYQLMDRRVRLFAPGTVQFR